MYLARRSVHSHAIGFLALVFVAFGCGSEESPPAAAPPEPAAQEAPGSAAPPEPAAQAAPAAPSPSAPPAAAPEPVAEAPEWAGELPVDFPADVPRYPGSKLTYARGTEDLGIVVTFDSPDTVDAVAKFYSDGFAAQGWQARVEQDDEGIMILADKDNRQASAIVHAGGQGALIELLIITVE